MIGNGSVPAQRNPDSRTLSVCETAVRLTRKGVGPGWRPLSRALGYMVFSYYHKLSPEQKRIYRESDAVQAVLLQNAQHLHPLIPQLVSSLENEDQVATEAVCSALASGIAQSFDVPPLRVRVLPVRPSESWGELQGLYVPARGTSAAVITLWMRTAKRRRVVAFKSFLRTLLHEICHHLDYEFLKLEESYHTAGFYQRESSLFHQLLPPGFAG